MRIHSDSFEHGRRLAAEFAAGQPTADGYGFAPNRNPHLAWTEVPAATRSFALLCIDPDVPTVAEMVGRDDVQIPVAQPRTDFCHWAMADLPPDLREIAAGSCSDGVVARGKAAPAGPQGAPTHRADKRQAAPHPDALRHRHCAPAPSRPRLHCRNRARGRARSSARRTHCPSP